MTARRRRLRFLKYPLIIALMVLAVFQTGRLWLINIANRNFFNVFSQTPPAAAETLENFIRPYRVVSGSGDGFFNIQYSGLTNAESWQYGQSALSAVLTNGEFAGAVTVDYEKLLASQVYLYDYNFQLPSETLARALNSQRAATLTSRGVASFDRVAVQPPASENESLQVYFIRDGDAFAFRLPETGAQTRFIRTIEPARSSGRLAYVPAGSEVIAQAAPGQFIATWEEGFPYPPVVITNPYTNDYGEKLISFIQTRAEPLFDNPAAINAEVGADGVYTFSTQNTVVRFTEEDILEYNSYRAVDSAGTVNVVRDYSAAAAFIAADNHIVNETYLAGYEEQEGRHVFRFDYVINDLPLLLQSGHPIEVTVDRGMVTRYRKLAYNFHTDSSESFTGSIKFDEWIDPKTRADKVRLGYRIDNQPVLILYWFVENAGNVLLQPIGS
ncbi:MAG: hypothetical protein LBR83_09515 [Clostridiales bacterium]|jgi:hypothetical protein|nr:hypothetical protein [Clostridiales bacterium]